MNRPGANSWIQTVDVLLYRGVNYVTLSLHYSSRGRGRYKILVGISTISSSEAVNVSYHTCYVLGG